LEDSVQSTPFKIKSKAVRAGAGAGKTYNLTHQVLDFVSDFHKHTQKWPHLMVTTFTIKATQELSERLIELALEERPELVEYVSSPGYMTVSTIHGILDKFLKKHGHLIGLASDFTYFKKSEMSFQSKKLLKRLIESSENHQKLLSVFSFSYLHKIIMASIYSHLEGHEVLTREHLTALLREELSGQKKKLIPLLNDLKNREIDGPWIELAQALEGILGVLSIEKWEKNYPLFLETLSTINLRSLSSKKHPLYTDFYEQTKETVNELRVLEKSIYDMNHYGHIEEVHKTFSALREEFDVEFFELKRRLNKIELSDLEDLSLRLIREFPECARQYALSKDFWLIDEFQDTSPVQVEILNALVGPRESYIVGDPQQSIYLFRGARTEVFYDKVKRIKEARGEEQFLDTNYRSTAPLLALMNRISENLGEGFQSMKSAFVAEANPKERVAQFVVVHGGDKRSDTQRIEAEKLAQTIQDLHRQGVGYESMCILMRSHGQIDRVAAVLLSKNIPIFVHSSGSFWQRREIIDALSLLKFLVNPRDDFNLVRLLRSPFIGISEQQLADIMQSRKADVWEAIRGPLEAGDLGNSGKMLWKIFTEKDVYGFRVSFIKAVEALGFFDFHLKYDPVGRAEGNLWKFIHLLKTFEGEPGANYVQFINEAERGAEAESSIEAPGSVKTNTVNLMTVHAAKGLQFDYVFLPFLGDASYRKNMMDFMIDEEKRVWSVRTPLKEEDLKTSGSLFERKVLAERKRREDDEDWRVFYVAYTRAKKFLYFSWNADIKEKSWAGKLAFDFTPGLHEEPEFSYLVEEVTDLEIIDTPVLKESARAPAGAPFSFTRADYYLGSSEDHLSVTKMVGQGDTVSYRSSFIKKRQGVLFHRLLELLRYPENTDFRQTIAEWFPDSAEDVSEALQYILTNESPPYVKIIKQGEVEWPFVLQQNSDRIQGQIDLWGIVDDVLWVVDYKSGEKVLKEKAFAQLSLYANALRQHLHWNKQIQLVVVYPFLKKEFMVPVHF
jgi:ATP-dependent helicase/nuclease subunit A